MTSRQPDPVTLFNAIVESYASNSSVVKRRMFSSENVLAVNGKIFAMLNRNDLVVKLSKQRVDELVASRTAGHFDPGHGRLMKEWVSIPAGRHDWAALVNEAFAFVSGRATAPAKTARGKTTDRPRRR